MVPYLNKREEREQPAKKGGKPEYKRAAGMEGYSLRGIKLQAELYGWSFAGQLFAQALQAWENCKGCQETQNLL